MALVVHFLSDGQAEVVAVEAHHRLHVLDEQSHPLYPRDLVKPCEQESADVVGLRDSHFARAQALLDGDSVFRRLHHLGVFGLVRQLRRLRVAHAVHLARLRVTVPADLLDSVVELVGVAVGIRRIEMPVRSRQIAARAADLLPPPGKPVERVRHLLQRPDLPGDLVERPRGLERMRVEDRVGVLGKKHERMVIGAVAREVADRRADARALVLGQPRAEVDRVGDAKAEQPAVKILALLRIGDVHAEVAQAPDAERPAHDHAAHLELCRRDRRGEAFGFVHAVLLTSFQSPHCTPDLDRKRSAAHALSKGPLPREGKGSRQNKGGTMKARHPFVLAIAALALFAFNSGARAEPPKTVAVDCSAGETIAKALTLGDERKPLLVQISGTCSEHLLIDRNDVTLAAGAPDATITGPDPAIDVIKVTASRVAIEGLTVTGGRNGITADGAPGLIVRNATVQGTGRNGITYSRGASGMMDGCTECPAPWRCAR